MVDKKSRGRGRGFRVVSCTADRSVRQALVYQGADRIVDVRHHH